MNTSHWTERLSEYLDGDLSNAERDACEQHLAGCAECAGVLEELKAVAAAARALPGAPPPAELWNAIEARLETPVLAMRPRAEIRERLARRWTFSAGQLAAMAACLVAVTAAAMWLATHGSTGSPGAGTADPVATVPGGSAPSPSSGSDESSTASPEATLSPEASAPQQQLAHLDDDLAERGEHGRDGSERGEHEHGEHARGESRVRDAVRPRRTDFDAGVPAVAADFGVNRYDAAIAELQTSLDQRRSTLDSSTVKIVEQNLAIIDKAIADARAALAADPSSRYLNTYLASTMRRKVDFLRRVNSLARI